MSKSKPKSEKTEAPLPPLTPRERTEFRKDLKRLKKRNYDMAKIRTVIDTLCARKRLDQKQMDHGLSGEWAGWRDCHIEPDWVMIY